MFRKLLAALSASFLLGTPNAAPQTVAEVETSMQELAAWMAEYRPIIEGLFNLFEPADDAGFVAESHLAGDVSLDEATSYIEEMRDRLKNQADDMRGAVNRLPPYP
ncbi:MAG: hypothetical protein WA989_01450, partial [Henriciella sp.]|uniref:hypothetical protein n=1 Tax=Henriciella sp. TaxID=1968823 RepID=UPI003C76EC44